MPPFRLAALLALLLPLGARAQDPTAARLADLKLATAVQLALAADARTRAFDVEVTVQAGTVALGGRLDDARRQTAAEVARIVPGVLAVAGEAPNPTRPAAIGPPTGRTASPSARPAPSEGATVHTVARGETLFSLARRYNTTVEAVRRLNGMTNGEIRVGQRLRMR